MQEQPSAANGSGRACPEKIAGGRASLSLPFGWRSSGEPSFEGHWLQGIWVILCIELRLFCISFSKSPSLYSSAHGAPFLAKASQVFDYG